MLSKLIMSGMVIRNHWRNM